MKKIVLYSTLGCHLCEQAKSLVLPIASGLNYQVNEIDIADSEELVERYGISIPVLMLCDDEAESEIQNDKNNIKKELFWPFDADQIFAFISN
ncbi:MAG: glutaredoxin family protein [Cellvibrionaceae bacterium]